MKLKLDQIRANTWNCNFMSEQEKDALKQCMQQAGPEKTLPIIVRLMATSENLYFSKNSMLKNRATMLFDFLKWGFRRLPND